MFVSAPSIPLSPPVLPRLSIVGHFVARAARGAWFLPLCVALLAAVLATPTQAQPTVQTVAVLDFTVALGVDPLWGRKAADALAVELQRSGAYEVVTRQRVDEVRVQQAGLGEPFNEITQSRLAIAVGASDVFSGRVAGVDITPTRASRVRLEVRQLEAATGDFVEGTQVAATTEQPVIEVPNEVLSDDALNKAAYAAVRALASPSTRTGNVLNTTRDDVELSIGARNGVVVGQRYAVLRDIYNPIRRVTALFKIGELIVRSVDANSAVGALSEGGAVGIRTGDRIRQIYVPNEFLSTRNTGRTRSRFNSRSSSRSSSNSSNSSMSGF